jgi:hypothetical protein
VGGDTLTVEFTPDDASIEIFDNLEGSYLIKYRVDIAGTFVLSVVTNSDAAEAKASTVTVVPNQPWPQASGVVFDATVILDQEYTVSVEVFDQFANPIIVE